MTNTVALLHALRESGGGAVVSRQTLNGLDLLGRVIDVPLNLSGARIIGPVQFEQTELRGGQIPNRANRICDIGHWCFWVALHLVAQELETSDYGRRPAAVS